MQGQIPQGVPPVGVPTPPMPGMPPQQQMGAPPAPMMGTPGGYAPPMPQQVQAPPPPGMAAPPMQQQPAAPPPMMPQQGQPPMQQQAPPPAPMMGQQPAVPPQQMTPPPVQQMPQGQPPVQQPQQPYQPPMQQPQAAYPPPASPGGVGYQQPPPQAVQQAPANVQFYATNVAAYAEEAKNRASGGDGDFWDKWPGNNDGTPSNWIVRIAPSLTPDGRWSRYVQKFFIPKDFNDPNGEKDVFSWPEGSTAALGRECPLSLALTQLNQMGVPGGMLDKMEPQDCFYVLGWFRNPQYPAAVQRTKAMKINLKKMIYNAMTDLIGKQSALYGDPFNPDVGWDWSISRTGKGMQSKYSATIAPCAWTGGRGAVSPDPNQYQECLRSLTPLPEAFPVPTPEQLQAMEVAAQRMLVFYSALSSRAAAGMMVPPSPAGYPQYPQQQYPQQQQPYPQQPYMPPQAMPQQAPPPQQQYSPPPPTMPPQAYPGQPGMPPPPMGAPVSPGQMAPVPAPMPGMPPGYVPQPGQPGGYAPQPGVPGQPSFNQGSATTAASAPEPVQPEGGKVTHHPHTIDSSRALAATWGIEPQFVQDIDASGYFVTVVLPEGHPVGAGTWFYSLIEEHYVRGEKQGQQKSWRTDKLAGIRKHVNAILRESGQDVLPKSSGSRSKKADEPVTPPVPVAEPTFPTDQTAPPPQPVPQPMPVQQPMQQLPVVASSPQPNPGTSPEATGGQAPVCFFNPHNPTQTGWYAISPGNPLTCSTCAWETPCQTAADRFRAQQQPQA